MRKNLHGSILKNEPKEQHLSTVPKSCFILIAFFPIFKFSPFRNKGSSLSSLCSNINFGSILKVGGPLDTIDMALQLSWIIYPTIERYFLTLHIKIGM